MRMRPVTELEQLLKGKNFELTKLFFLKLLRWEMSQTEIPVELDIEQQTQPVNKEVEVVSDEKTVPVIIRWPWPAKSVTVICSCDGWKR